ncbi:amidase domain-containing protein [Streptomyces sp. NPDC086783]|uniref:amidase domain-containing protein n=1 Tax=Streptomyces sp. NPDC086783 TaxID=3365758 RepID=UPI00380093C0
MKSRKLSRTRRRATIVTAAAASVVAGAAMLPNWSAGASSAGAGEPAVDAATKATFQRLADAVFTDRTDALVDHKQNKGRSPLTSRFSGDVELSSSLENKEDSARSSLRGRKSRLADLGERYSSAKTSVTLDKTRVRDRHATVQVTETTTLTYAKVQGDEPKTTGFQAHHKLTFTADRSGVWQLTNVRTTDDGYLAVNQPAKTTFTATVADDDMPAATRSATTWPAPAKAKNFSATGYDYKAMAAYAEKYWKTYNTAYPDFNGAGAGGDCTNFVSQSLKAGGWKHVPGYVYDYTKWFGNADIQSDSFVGVNEFSWFSLNSKRATSLANVYQMDIGDVLQVDFDKDGSKDHTMIVSYRSSQGVPYVTYHSTNTYRRSVASIIASYPNSAFYAYRT